MEKNILINGDNKTKIIFKNNFINKYIDGLEKLIRKFSALLILSLKK